MTCVSVTLSMLRRCMTTAYTRSTVLLVMVARDGSPYGDLHQHSHMFVYIFVSHRDLAFISHKVTRGRVRVTG